MKILQIQIMSYNKNEIDFCKYCGSSNFREVIIDSIEHTVCESKIICLDCGEIINYWEYGYYENDISSEYLKMKTKRDRKLKLEEIEKCGK